MSNILIANFCSASFPFQTSLQKLTPLMVYGNDDPFKTFIVIFSLKTLKIRGEIAEFSLWTLHFFLLKK